MRVDKLQSNCTEAIDFKVTSVGVDLWKLGCIKLTPDSDLTRNITDVTILGPCVSKLAPGKATVTIGAMPLGKTVAQTTF